MPLLQLHLTDVPLTHAQRSGLQIGLSARMASILGKRLDLTVLNITQSASASWSVGGQPLADVGWCASLTVHITAGTNTAEELASFIASACALLQEVLAAPALSPPSAPVYIVINEVDARSWGYDGRTQQSRRPAAPLQLA